MSTSELTAEEMVRTLTGYADNENELPEEELQSHLKIGRMVLRNKYNVTDSEIDSHDGLLQALGARTAIFAKAAVENITVSSYSIGDETVSVQNVRPEDSQQFQLWADLAKDGLEDFDGSLTLTNTASFVGETMAKGPKPDGRHY